MAREKRGVEERMSHRQERRCIMFLDMFMARKLGQGIHNYEVNAKESIIIKLFLSLPRTI